MSVTTAKNLYKIATGFYKKSKKNNNTYEDMERVEPADKDKPIRKQTVALRVV